MAEALYVRWWRGHTNRPTITKSRSPYGSWFVDFNPHRSWLNATEVASFRTFEEAVAWLVENDPRRTTT